VLRPEQGASLHPDHLCPTCDGPIEQPPSPLPAPPQLYATHRLGAVHKGVMEYMHVSKSGGTSWCHVARE
jgi:hypothetical protein